MPHVKLELSSNILEEIDERALFSSIHQILAHSLAADIGRCMSRLIQHEHFHIGEGSSTNAFIYLEISCFAGRTPPMIKEAGEKLLKTLQQYFSASANKLNIQIAVNILEFPAENYFKIEPQKI